MFFDLNNLGHSEVHLVDAVAPLTLSGRRKQRKGDASRSCNRPAKRGGNARRGGTGVRYGVIGPEIRRIRTVGICPTRGRPRKLRGRDALINTAHQDLPGERVAARDTVRRQEWLVIYAVEKSHRIVYLSAVLGDDLPHADPGQDEKLPSGVCVHVHIEAIVGLARRSGKLIRKLDYLVARDTGQRGNDIVGAANLAAGEVAE